MRPPLWCTLLAIALATVPAAAQYKGRGFGAPRANQGHLPPAPVARPDRHTPAEVEIDPSGRANAHPHVSHDHWYGHDRPDDPRYQFRPGGGPHGRFAHFGPAYRYTVVRIDRGLHRIWLPGGFFFAIAAWDWTSCADWCWDCGDDFVIYDDPDHPGWYLLYNIHTGAYVHIQYLGP